MKQEPNGPVVMITGTGKGLGKAVASALVEAGGRVVLVVRSASAAASLAEEYGTSAVTLARDVTAPDAAEAAMAAGLKRWGQVDGLVNNAGIIEPIARLDAADPAQWELTIATNLTAPYRFTRAFLSLGAKARKRRIVNISSGAAHKPLEGWSAYCASKAALAMLTRSVQLEYAGDGILAFGLIPGLVDTGMQETVRASGVNEVSRLPKTALRPAAEPARAVTYLLSGEADDLAGGELEIRDAGFRRRAGLPAM
jgi:NAD(P)-dependent dehydrogenase (short-subunit alcohol dehydrogenase family)